MLGSLSWLDLLVNGRLCDVLHILRMCETAYFSPGVEA